MARKLKTEPSEPVRKIRPALSQEGRENQLISLAYDLAEKRLLDGSASSQEVTHFLKMGSAKARLEMKRLQVDTELSEAKKASIESQQRVEELYKNALDAMRNYAGYNSGDDEYDY